MALVIGCAAYEHARPLRAPTGDAACMASLLENLDFEVISGFNCVYTGTIAWRQALGTCTADPTALAVSLDAGAAPILFAVLDPLDGPRLELRAPWQPAPIVLTPATCPGLRVDIRQRGQRDDGTQLLDGSLAASCTLPRGTDPPIRLDLDAWFRGCGMAEP